MKILSRIKKRMLAIASAGAIALGAYTPNYTTQDLADITGDVIGTGMVAVKDYAELGVLILMLIAGTAGWVKIRDSF